MPNGGHADGIRPDPVLWSDSTPKRTTLSAAKHLEGGGSTEDGHLQRRGSRVPRGAVLEMELASLNEAQTFTRPPVT